MQEPYPRSQSVLQTRSSNFQTTASRIFSKVSTLKGKFRLGNKHKSIDDNNPYMSRGTRSMDLDMHVAKPYMSQPMLSIPSMLHANDMDEVDSTGSSSQSMHNTRRPIDGLPITATELNRRYQAQLEDRPKPKPKPQPHASRRPTTSDSTVTVKSAVIPTTPPIHLPSPPSLPAGAQKPHAVVPAPSPVDTPSSPSFNPSTLPSSNPTRRASIPRLAQPLPGPGQRFSLIMSETESASARLSPSIIIRQPVLPMHLPTLKIPHSEGGDDTTFFGSGIDDGSPSHRISANEGPSTFGRRMSGLINSPVMNKRQSLQHIRAQSRRNLRTMPALPMAGSDRPDDGDNDDSDGESDEAEEDEDTDVDHVEPEDEEDDPRMSSVSLQSPSTLPNVDVSRLDLSFLNFPPPSQEPKGKERERGTFDDGKTPTTRTPRPGIGHDYFSVHYGSGGNGSRSEYSRGATPRVHILTTPKPRHADSTPKGHPAELSLSRTPPIPILGRPGMYKHPSKSMVEILVKGDVSDNVEGGIRKPSKAQMQTKSDINPTTTTTMANNKSNSSSSQIPDRVAETATIPSPVPSPDLIPSDFESEVPRARPTRTDAFTIFEEPRDPNARKDTLALAAPPNLSEEQHLAHIQAPAPRPLSTTAGTLLRRRSSLPTFNVTSPPPPYPSFMLEYSHGQPFPAPPPTERHPHQPPPPSGPHLDEGKEHLPAYTNDVLLRAIMPRKVEFIKPGVQAKDRKWRRVVCELEGTVFRVYRCPPGYAGTGKVVDWWERKVGVGDVSVGGTGGQGTGGTGAGGTSTISSTGGGAGANLTPEQKLREQERLRLEKIENERGRGGGDQTYTEIPLPPPMPTSTSSPPSPVRSSGQMRDRSVSRASDRDRGTTSLDGPSRSRLGLGNLLKAPKSHKRTQSEFRSVSGSSSAASRSSFNLPRPSLGGSSMLTVESSNERHGNLSPSVSSLSVSIPSSSSSVSAFGSASMESPSASPTPTTSQSTNRFPHAVTCPPPNKNDLIRMYTLQQAESGLGNDYVKRKNVIRVRMEGEQFLLQAKDVTDVVDWIEGLHTATNIALDLDERPMPRGPIFPRRRRRRPRRTAETGAQNETVTVTVSAAS